MEGGNISHAWPLQTAPCVPGDGGSRWRRLTHHRGERGWKQYQQRILPHCMETWFAAVWVPTKAPHPLLSEASWQHWQRHRNGSRCCFHPAGHVTDTPELSRVETVPVRSISLMAFCIILVNEVILQNTQTFMMISRWLSGCHTRSLRDLSALVLVNVTTATDQMEGVYNFGDFCVVLPRCLKSFPDVPTFLCFTTYAPSWLFWKVYYSQEILLPLHNAWTCHFYIRYGFHIYFLKKAGFHVLLWSWSNDKKSTALNTTRCYNANVSKVRQYFICFIFCYPENCTMTIYR